MATQWLAERTSKIASSAIREILKFTERPSVISFAGGLPSPEAFPVEEIRDACARLLRDDPSRALQYDVSEGFQPLREWIAARYSRGGTPVAASNVLITSGTQQALDLVGKVVVERGRPLLMERPTYFGAVQAFALGEPQWVFVPCDDAGPLPESLATAGGPDARVLYLLPTFQNPTGRCIDLDRRRQILEVCRARDLLIIEDDPYGELVYSGEPVPTLFSLAPERVVYASTFSKVLAPGLRVGFVIAPKPLMTKLVQVKQAADLHTSSLTQRIAYEVVRDGFLDRHLPGLRALYARKIAVMLKAMETHFPRSVRWNRPAGGMFIWVTLPEAVDAVVLLEEALARDVVFVPGATFYPDEPKKNTLRLAFATVPEAQIRLGIEVLGGVIRAWLEKNGSV